MIKKIEGLKHYGIDEFGNVYSLRKEKPIKMKTYVMKNGYVGITISENGKRHKLLVHRLVAKAFIPNINNYTDVDHIDFNRQNNSVGNLQWCTRSKNIKRAYDSGRMNQSYKPQKFIVKIDDKIVKEEKGLLKICKEISSEYNVSYHALVKYKKYGNIEIIKCND